MARPEIKREGRPTRFSFDDVLDKPHEPMKQLRRLLRECLLPHWVTMAIAIGGMMVTAATSGALPFLLQKVGDFIFVSKDPRQLFVLPFLIIILMIIRAVADFASTVAEGSVGARIVADLRMRMFTTIAAADLAWIQRNHSGHFVAAFFNDVTTIDRAATKVITGFFKNMLSIVFLLGAMLYMDWRLGLVAMIGTPIAIFNVGHQKKRINTAVGRSLRDSGDLNSILTQTLQGMRVVKAYGQEEREWRRLNGIVRSLRKQLMRITRSRATVGPAWEITTGVGLGLAILYGGWQGIYGNVSLGHFMGFVAACLLAFQPMKSLATIQVSLSEGLLAASRVFALIDHSSFVIERPGAARLKVSVGAISFRNVDFGYVPGIPVLSNFNLELEPGRKLALVGPSGAGKSTVLNLILRFFDPESGSVMIDGQDLKDTTIASVRASSALLTQDPVLFDDTIAANIAYGSEGASEEAIEAAAKAAAAHEFIERLPDGYQSRVGEAGNRLSGGERQRIAFARAMLRNTPILLLDEPTSALDAGSELKVQETMERLLQGRTVVMIAHRLSTVQKADQIFYMENGRVLETGTHSELVARRGRYARMVQTQMLGDEPPLFARAGG